MALKHQDLTHRIIGCAMKVHNVMGPGYRENIYSRCLAIELDRAGMKYEREIEAQIYYDGILVGKKKVDYIIEGTISLELKAISELTDKELNQALNYLETHHMENGLLINFGASSLQFKRLFNKRNSSKHPGNPAYPSNPGSNPRL
jgi:GxxExxY protein